MRRGNYAAASWPAGLKTGGMNMDYGCCWLQTSLTIYVAVAVTIILWKVEYFLLKTEK